MTDAKLLHGKTAVITGASRGIGQAIADTFLQQGARVIACTRTETDDLKAWMSAHHQTGAQVDWIQLDLAEADSLNTTVKEIRSLTPQIDILVNCAGIASGGLFQMTRLTDMKALFDVNFFHPLAFTQGVARLMTRQRSGNIINITSTASDIVEPGTLVYGSSKAALARATQSLAAELGAQGIRVNAIAPGITDTDMAAAMDPAARQSQVDASALGQAAHPQDIANTALFLASELSSHITGQILRVDGGIARR